MTVSGAPRRCKTHTVYTVRWNRNITNSPQKINSSETSKVLKHKFYMTFYWKLNYKWLFHMKRYTVSNFLTKMNRTSAYTSRTFTAPSTRRYLIKWIIPNNEVLLGKLKSFPIIKILSEVYGIGKVNIYSEQFVTSSDQAYRNPVHLHLHHISIFWSRLSSGLSSAHIFHIYPSNSELHKGIN